MGRVITTRLLHSLLLAAIVGCGAGGPLEPPGRSTLRFADRGLEAAVRVALRRPTGDLLPSDVVGLTWFSASGYGIRDLSGIEELSSLQSLVLSSNQIDDIRPLSGLTSLNLLYLNDNAVRDLSPLLRLTALQNLDLAGNQVRDLSPLAQLKGLEILYLNGNRVEDLGALAELHNLEILYLASNQIQDLFPLANLKTLNTLNLSNNLIREILSLSGLPRLVYLRLNGNRITDLGPLVSNRGIDDFDTIVLSDNPLTDYALSVQIPAIEARRVTVVLGDPISS